MLIIADRTYERPEPLKNKPTDELDGERFNALPSPVIARLWGRMGDWAIESLCVATGCMRIDVCGKTDLKHFSDIKLLIDADGYEHDPDDFWNE